MVQISERGLETIIAVLRDHRTGTPKESLRFNRLRHLGIIPLSRSELDELTKELRLELINNRLKDEEIHLEVG